MSQELTLEILRESKQRLLDDYFPKIRRCLDRLSEDDIWRRPNDNSNSIGNLMLHLCGNVRQWMIHGLGGKADVRRRQSEFDEQGPIPKQQLLERMEGVLIEACEVIAQQTTESLLTSRIIQGFETHGYGAIFHVVEHFSQHTGQIIYITKMNTGEDLRFFDLDEKGHRRQGSL